MDGTVDMAHSELRGLITKAARGAGLPWGLAEEAGWAAEWLARRALPAGEWAALWLAAEVEGRAGPVAFGASLADRLASGAEVFVAEAMPDGLAAPGYVLPFLHLVAAGRGAGVEIAGPTGQAVRVDPDGTVIFGPAWSDRPQGWRVGPATASRCGARAVLSLSLVDCLDGLALRTTVPPSEASRRNAGSATSDND